MMENRLSIVKKSPRSLSINWDCRTSESWPLSIRIAICFWQTSAFEGQPETAHCPENSGRWFNLSDGIRTATCWQLFRTLDSPFICIPPSFTSTEVCLAGPSLTEILENSANTRTWCHSSALTSLSDERTVPWLQRPCLRILLSFTGTRWPIDGQMPPGCAGSSRMIPSGLAWQEWRRTPGTWRRRKWLIQL